MFSIDPKYDGYQKRLASMVYKFFDKKSSGWAIKPEPNYELANELQSFLKLIFINIVCISFFFKFLNYFFFVNVPEAL